MYNNKKEKGVSPYSDKQQLDCSLFKNLMHLLIDNFLRKQTTIGRGKTKLNNNTNQKNNNKKNRMP